MRVLLVGRSFPFHSKSGGMETVAWDLAVGLAHEGCRVTILTTRVPKKIALGEVEDLNIDAVEAPSGKYSYSWWVGSKKHFIENHSTNTDIVLSVGSGAYSVANYIKRKKIPIPILMQVHGTSVAEFSSKVKVKSVLSWVKSLNNVIWFFRDSSYQNFDCLIPIGSVVEKDLASWPTKLLVRKVPVRPIFNGVSEQMFNFSASARGAIREQYNIAQDVPLLIYCGRLHRQKSIENSLRALSLLKGTAGKTRLLIVGDGPDCARLMKLVANLNLVDDVIFAGAQPRERLSGFYSAADMFILLTERKEGLPVAPLEALACGLPCIVSNHLDDLVPFCQAVDPANVSEIASAFEGVDPWFSNKKDNRTSKLPPAFSLNQSLSSYIKLFQEFENT